VLSNLAFVIDAIKEFGLEPGTFTEVNTFCASAKPESDTANAATTASFSCFPS